MIPLAVAKALGPMVEAAFAIYNAIQEQKRRRSDDPESRLAVETMDVEALAALRELWRHKPS